MLTLKTKLIIVIATLLAAGTMAALGVNQEAKRIEGLLEAYAAAMSSMDEKRIGKVLAGNDLSVFESPSSEPNFGWDDYRTNHLAKEFEIIEKHTYSISDPEVVVDRTLGFARFNYGARAKLRGRNGATVEVESRGVGTAVVRREGEEWKILHLNTYRQYIGEVAAPVR
jgi:ketosteroid isomerase-like protein